MSNSDLREGQSQRQVRHLFTDILDSWGESIHHSRSTIPTRLILFTERRQVGREVKRKGLIQPIFSKLLVGRTITEKYGFRNLFIYWCGVQGTISAARIALLRLHHPILSSSTSHVTLLVSYSTSMFYINGILFQVSKGLETEYLQEDDCLRETFLFFLSDRRPKCTLCSCKGIQHVKLIVWKPQSGFISQFSQSCLQVERLLRNLDYPMYVYGVGFRELFPLLEQLLRLHHPILSSSISHLTKLVGYSTSMFYIN